MNNITATSKLLKDRNASGADESSQTNRDLVSLISSGNSAMRILAARNFKYYPEYLSTLLDRLAIETNETVMLEIKNSILELSLKEPANLIIENKVRELINSEDNERLLELTCQDILYQITN